jgi:hypothetical protein
VTSTFIDVAGKQLFQAISQLLWLRLFRIIELRDQNYTTGRAPAGNVPFALWADLANVYQMRLTIHSHCASPDCGAKVTL